MYNKIIDSVEEKKLLYTEGAMLKRRLKVQKDLMNCTLFYVKQNWFSSSFIILIQVCSKVCNTKQVLDW